MHEEKDDSLCPRWVVRHSNRERIAISRIHEIRSLLEYASERFIGKKTGKRDRTETRATLPEHVTSREVGLDGAEATHEYSIEHGMHE
jgi:hypothetical protein